MKRRSFLTGLLAAPVVITTPGLLMPVKALEKPCHYSWSYRIGVPDYLLSDRYKVETPIPSNWRFIRRDNERMMNIYEVRDESNSV